MLRREKRKIKDPMQNHEVHSRHKIDGLDCKKRSAHHQKNVKRSSPDLGTDDGIWGD